MFGRVLNTLLQWAFFIWNTRKVWGRWYSRWSESTVCVVYGYFTLLYATLLKLTLLHGCFSRLLNCAHGINRATHHIQQQEVCTSSANLLLQPYHTNTWHLSAFLYTLQAHVSSTKTHPVRYTSSTTRLKKVPNPRIPRKFDVIQVIWENKLTDF